MKELRKQARLTQEEVATLTGFSKRFISYVENGQRNLSRNSIKKFAKVYKVTSIDIFKACERTKCSKK